MGPCSFLGANISNRLKFESIASSPATLIPHSQHPTKDVRRSSAQPRSTKCCIGYDPWILLERNVLNIEMDQSIIKAISPLETSPKRFQANLRESRLTVTIGSMYVQL